MKISFLTKPFLRKIRSIKSDVAAEANICLNDTTIVAHQKLNLIDFSSDLLTESQRVHLKIGSDVIQTILSKKGFNYDYCITKISKVHNNIYCINVDQCYCLIKNVINKSNRVYFIYNLDSNILRFKWFNCGQHNFLDIHVSLE